LSSRASPTYSGQSGGARGRSSSPRDCRLERALASFGGSPGWSSAVLLLGLGWNGLVCRRHDRSRVSDGAVGAGSPRRLPTPLRNLRGPPGLLPPRGLVYAAGGSIAGPWSAAAPPAPALRLCSPSNPSPPRRSFFRGFRLQSRVGDASSPPLFCDEDLFFRPNQVRSRASGIIFGRPWSDPRRLATDRGPPFAASEAALQPLTSTGRLRDRRPPGR